MIKKFKIIRALHRIRGCFLLPLHSIQSSCLLPKTHQNAFAKYKNKFSEQDLVLMATGPSLQKFKPVENAVYVGVNRAFQWDGAPLDFLFMQDYTGLDYIEDAAFCPAKKFYGILRNDLYLHVGQRGYRIPDSIAKRHGAERYYVNAAHDPLRIHKNLEFAHDLLSQPLTCYGSVCFPAMQFMLWTNPRRIYIVGVDLSHGGYFDGKGGINNTLGLDGNLRGWMKMKEFAQMHYPDTEIISVNPVGLRGLFRDLDFIER